MRSDLPTLSRFRPFASTAVLALTLPYGAAAAQTPPPTVSIHDIQSSIDPSYPNGASQYYGQQVTVTGTVTATTYFGYFVAEAPGAWGAILVYSYGEAPDPGDEVRLSGTVTEYYGMTELEDVTSFVTLSTGNPVVPTVLPAGAVSDERYESVLVTVEDVTVAGLYPYGDWLVADSPTSYTLCGVANDFPYFPRLGDRLESLTGVVDYSYGAFHLQPRATQDLVGDVLPHYALHGHVVTMNDARDVLVSGYVEIDGDRIVAVHRQRPSGVRIVPTGGLIFPGLIDSHDHPAYNVLGPIPFGRTFADRYAWRSEPIYADFGQQLDSIRNHGGNGAQRANLRKFAEIRALCAGTTSIQGDNCNGYGSSYFAQQGIVIDNIERFPTRAYHSTFPLWEPQAFWMAMGATYYDRFIVHLAEGTNPAARDEFLDWAQWGMLDGRTAIIHGVALQPPDLTAMAAAGAHLIWSPQSNLTLYGATADIPAALAAGVNVALAPDWTESGSMNLLDELRVADDYDNGHWGDVLSPQDLTEFVTRNAALAVGCEGLIGQIRPGYRANLMVVPGSPVHPYRALLRAEPARVKLTVVSGRPMYGSPEVMAGFPFLEGQETIVLGGETKTLAIRVDSHHIPEANKPFAQILAELEAAYAASAPKVCAFAGLE